MIGKLSEPLTLANDQPWAEDQFRFWAGDDSTPWLVASAECWLRLGTEGDAPDLALSSADGGIEIEDNAVTPMATAEQMGALTAGVYRFEMKVIGQDGLIRQLRGQANVLGGLG